MKHTNYLTFFLCFAVANFTWAQATLEVNSVSNALMGEVQINNVTEINSSGLDFSPVYFEDGVLLTSTRQSASENRSWFRKTYTDLYFSAKTSNGTYQTPVALPALINSKFHDGIVSLNPEGSTMYFSRNDKRPTGFTKKKVRLKIFSAERNNETWSAVQELPFNLDKYSTCHPTMNSTGDLLYFASDRPGGLGGMDLYVCEFRNGQWQHPQNLGPSINTAKNELFPFIAPNGQLYFASDGHQGMGKLDLFVAYPDADQWAVQNLGKPFNSWKDDFGFVIHENEQEGFFSSDRDGGLGKDDIYAWSIVDLERPLSKVDAPAFETVQAEKIVYGKKLIKVLDDVTQNPLSQVKVVISEANKPGKVVRYFTDVNGLIDFNWDSTSKYFFSTSKDGYSSYNKILSPDELAGEEEMTIYLKSESPVDFAMVAPTEPVLSNSPKVAEVKPEPKVSPLKEEIDEYFLKEEKEMFSEGQLIQLDNIYYEFNEFVLQNEAENELRKVVELLNDYPEMEIELNAHTDAVGSETYNMWLSKQRAKAAVAYIVNNGIAQSRIEAKGYGESRLLNNCGVELECSRDEQALNRRTEFLIKKVGAKVVRNQSPSRNGTRDHKVKAIKTKSTGKSTTMLMAPIYYDFGREELWQEAQEELDKVAKLLKRHPDMKIRVLSYTDVVGNSSYNLKLSNRRAEIAAAYIRNQGIGQSQVEFKGMGETNINNHCVEGVPCSKAERRMNRRTEIQILNPGGAELAIQNEK